MKLKGKGLVEELLTSLANINLLNSHGKYSAVYIPRLLGNMQCSHVWPIVFRSYNVTAWSAGKYPNPPFDLAG